MAVSYQVTVCPKCGEIEGAHKFGCDYDPHSEIEQLRAEIEALREGGE